MVDINISAEELNDPAIDEIINLEKSLARPTGEFIEDIPTPFYMNPVFYYSLAGLIGSLAAWVLLEPLYSDADSDSIPFVSDYLLFGPVAGVIGLSLGLVYGLSNRNRKQALYCGVVGIGVGLGATIFTTFLADLLFGVVGMIAVEFADPRLLQSDEFPFRGTSFFIFMCGRGMAWSLVALGAGLSLGVALKSKKLLLNGIAGGMVGGLLGGLLFDPLDRFLDVQADEAALSRAIGVAAVGLLVGLFIGIFENISKEAWFQMLQGPLTGKQFIIFKSPMIIGSSPKCDIYIFKDPEIEPKHAVISKSGGKYLLTDGGSGSGTFVNGVPVDRYILQAGDVVTLGGAALKYNERQKA